MMWKRQPRTSRTSGFRVAQAEALTKTAERRFSCCTWQSPVQSAALAWLSCVSKWSLTSWLIFIGWKQSTSSSHFLVDPLLWARTSEGTSLDWRIQQLEVDLVTRIQITCRSFDKIWKTWCPADCKASRNNVTTSCHSCRSCRVYGRSCSRPELLSYRNCCCQCPLHVHLNKCGVEPSTRTHVNNPEVW